MNVHRLTAFFLSLTCATGTCATGCSKADPPCPPGTRQLLLKEADDALLSRARREVDKAPPRSGEGPAAEFTCGEQKTGFQQKVTLTFQDVLNCENWNKWTSVEEWGAFANLGSFGACLAQTAISKFIWHVPGVTVDGVGIGENAKLVRPTSECIEERRNVDVKAEKYGLNRSGPEEIVPAILILILNGMQGAMAPATAPAMFILKPAAGVEEACLDLPEEPTKRCTDTSGCPEVPPGAEVPTSSSSSGGSVILPGTDPSTPLPGDGDQ